MNKYNGALNAQTSLESQTEAEPKERMKMKFENVLEEVNGFGPFQLLTLILVTAPRIAMPAHFLLNNFIGWAPPHHCDISSLDGDGLFGNLSEEQRLAVSVPLGRDGEPVSCQMFAEPQLQLLDNRSAGADLPTVGCQSGWVYDNATFTATIATEWDLVCDRKSLTKTSSTVFFLGVMVGAVVFGYLSDRFGRKNLILASYVVTTVFGFASAFANSYAMFAVLRFFTGFGITGLSVVSLVLSLEWVDTANRSFIIAIGSLSWAVGNMMLPGYAYLINDWRTLTMVATAPLFAAIIAWWWTPESARWLLVNGKVEKAQLYLNKCAKVNKRPPPAKSKLETISNAEVLEKRATNYTYIHLFKTPQIRKTTLLIGIVWFGVATTYYGISLNITGFGLNMFLTHFIYAAIEVPSKVTVYFLLHFIGRKTCLVGSLLLSGICIATNIFVPKDLWHMRATVAVLGKGLSEASFTTVFLYTTELYPTVIRQNAVGYSNFMTRLGVAVAPLILLLEDAWTLLPQVIICSVAMACGLLTLLLPETRGIQLPESIDDVEKPRGKEVSSQCAESSGVFLESKSTEATGSGEN